MCVADSPSGAGMTGKGARGYDEERGARVWRSEWGHGVAEWGGVGFGPQIKSGATELGGGGRRLLGADSCSGAGMTRKGDGCDGVGSGYGG